jgi:hypothetical protein
MSATPTFASTPRVSNHYIDSAVLTTGAGNTERRITVSANVGVAFVAGAGGSMVTRMTICHVHDVGDPSAGGMIRIFHSPDSGTTYYLLKEVPVEAIDPEVGGSAFEGFRAQVIFNPPLFMPTGHQLGVTSHLNGGDDDFHITTEGGDL